MKSKYFFVFIVSMVLNYSLAQTSHPLLDSTRKWILLNNKIEKNEIFLAKYHPSKLRANSLVLSFVSNGKLAYTYESNPKVPAISSIDYLDIDLEESKWSFDTTSREIKLEIKAGYASLSDFSFSRIYSIEEVSDGFVLMKNKTISFVDLKNPKQNKTVVASSNQVRKLVEKKELVEQQPMPQPLVEKIDYLALYQALFDSQKRWILMKNKIERGDIYLTPYTESKLTINNLVLSLNRGKIEYDYESDPKINMCLGVDFLDIDSDNSSWKYDENQNIFTLTIKGGYASLDDFQFSREYKIEPFEDGMFYVNMLKYISMILERKRKNNVHFKTQE